MRNIGDGPDPMSMAFEGGIKGFIFKGTNGRWRDVLNADEVAAYQRRVAETLPPDAARWIEFGRSALKSSSVGAGVSIGLGDDRPCIGAPARQRVKRLRTDHPSPFSTFHRRAFVHRRRMTARFTRVDLTFDRTAETR